MAAIKRVFDLRAITDLTDADGHASSLSFRLNVKTIKLFYGVKQMKQVKPPSKVLGYMGGPEQKPPQEEQKGLTENAGAGALIGGTGCVCAGWKQEGTRKQGEPEKQG